MYHGSTLLPNDAPVEDESIAPKHRANGTIHASSRAGEDRSAGSSGRSEWRRKDSTANTSRSRAPTAQERESPSRLPAALPTDSSTILKHTAAPSPKATPTMADTSEEHTTQPADPGKVVISVPNDLFESLRSQCDNKASVALLGRIQGKHPGLKALTAWARKNLHSSLVLLSLQANNVFEVTFDRPEGRIHALNQADLTCESAAIFLSSWHPHYDANQLQDTEHLDYPVWMQVANLCQILRDERFLHTIGNQIGQVISIDSSEAYKAKLLGPRIRLLVQNLDALPHTVVLPRLDGKGTQEYALEFSGLPNQCGRCRSREHQVRNCPKKDITNRYQKSQPARKEKEAPQWRRRQEPTQLEDTPKTTPTTQEQAAIPENKQKNVTTTMKSRQGRWKHNRQTYLNRKRCSKLTKHPPGSQYTRPPHIAHRQVSSKLHRRQHPNPIC